MMPRKILAMGLVLCVVLASSYAVQMTGWVCGTGIDHIVTASGTGTGSSPEEACEAADIDLHGTLWTVGPRCPKCPPPANYRCNRGINPIGHSTSSLHYNVFLEIWQCTTTFTGRVITYCAVCD